MLDVKQAEPATNVRFQQVHKGVPVYLGQVLVKYDQAGEVQLVNNHTLADLDVDVTPQSHRRGRDAAGRWPRFAGPVADRRRPHRHAARSTATGVAPMLAWHVFVPHPRARRASGT